MIKKIKQKVRRVIRQEVVDGVQETGVFKKLQSIEASIQILNQVQAKKETSAVQPANEVEQLKLAVEDNSVDTALSVIKKWGKRKTSSKSAFLLNSVYTSNVV